MNDKDVIGTCVCTKCGFSMPAPKGVDCSGMKCPKCGGAMKNGGAGFEPLE
tara:strand:- start:88 stop:240 length:153 start_codon:yes stop_codon:yes gene_type:complete